MFADVFGTMNVEQRRITRSHVVKPSAVSNFIQSQLVCELQHQRAAELRALIHGFISSIVDVGGFVNIAFLPLCAAMIRYGSVSGDTSDNMI